MAISKQSQTGTLYLLPALLGGENTTDVLPEYNHRIMYDLDHFIVEDLRSARRFLRKAGYTKEFEKVWLGELNEHTLLEDIGALIAPLLKGHDTGLLSEAGVPCLADPGAEVVKAAQQRGIKVVPMTGPSSVILALMASGFNGQHFLFHGYLPRKPKEREDQLAQLERDAYQKNQTQIFIETPYRNLQMIESILKRCKPETMLCIGCDLTLPTESVLTKSISQWARSPLPYHKKPAVFLIFHP
jgi:16S rRNA (cytidine1402-2'-O)-methyltransferase